ncbi:MAG: polyprenyl synthetase family protein [Oscillospiraceae bacterium]
MSFDTKYAEYLSCIEKRLPMLANACFNENSRVGQAAIYSLLAGGKRTRGVLAMAVSDAFGGSQETALRFACAVEMLHCYSLIHDDLPCMDNDDYRRGKPSCHKAFGEDTALLAGDALLTGAFELLSAPDIEPKQAAKAVNILAKCAGANGMIWGQELDLHFETTKANEQELKYIHKNKTGMLINAAVQLGAVSADLDDEKRDILAQYAFAIGLCFQIIDDILDVTSTQEELGKPIGSDKQNNKTTFVSLYGLEASQNAAAEITENSCALLRDSFKNNNISFLCDMAASLSTRKK